MDLKSVLKRYDTKSKNTSDLTPHYVSREANKKLIEKLEARNRANVSKGNYHFVNMLDKLKGRPSISSMLDNPKAHAQNQDISTTNQKAELVRMAKITANEARGNMGTYEQTREQFITNYSPKINEFRMLPEIQGIFQQFSDPNYSEKGYDKNYLGQGASDKYLESILAGRQSALLTDQLAHLRANQSTTTGAVRNLLNPLNETNQRLNAMFVPLNRTNEQLGDLQRDLLLALEQTNTGIEGLGQTITDAEARRLLLKDAGERTAEEIQEQEANNKKIKEDAKARFEASKTSEQPLKEHEAFEEVVNAQLETFKQQKEELAEMSYAQFVEKMTTVENWKRSTLQAPTQLEFIKTVYNNMNKPDSVLHKKYLKLSKKAPHGPIDAEQLHEIERENNQLKKDLILEQAKTNMQKSVSTGFKSYYDILSPQQRNSASGTSGGAGAGVVQTPKPSGGIVSGLMNSVKKNLFGLTVAEQQTPSIIQATARPGNVLDFTGDIAEYGLDDHGGLVAGVLGTPLSASQSGGKRRSNRNKGKGGKK